MIRENTPIVEHDGEALPLAEWAERHDKSKLETS